jgi:6-phosphogluconolactonase
VSSVVKKKTTIKLNKTINIFSTPAELAERFAEDLVLMINESEKAKKSFTVSLSGGSTPEMLFSILGSKYSKSVPWKNVHFFWGDERCVSPDDSESNFGMTKRTLFDKINIPESNIHRIMGENDPSDEALRYSSEIISFTEKKNGLPSFDIVLLGLGEDGHTASIFPGNLKLLTSDKICDVAVNPYSGQKRITITGLTINNADTLFFLVTGKKKAEIVENIFKNKPASLNYPASYIVPLYGQLHWYLDGDAASMLSD